MTHTPTQSLPHSSAISTPRSVGPGVVAVDAEYHQPGIAAVHLIVDQGRAAIVDSGTQHSVAAVLAALAAHGLGPEAVDWILLTHVHLDHAGGAGAFARACPNARVVVHPRGARHLIDPAKLWAGTVAVYGADNAARLYGALLPIDATRVIEAQEGLRLPLGARYFEVLDTPGHARHHVCYYDSAARGWYTGDTFGLSYRALDQAGRQFIFPTSTPVHFDPPALHDSIERLLARDPQCMFLTHYSRVDSVLALAADLHRLIDALVEAALAEAATAPAQQHGALVARQRELVCEEAARSGWALQGEDACALLAMDMDLNAQGLQVWLAGREADK